MKHSSTAHFWLIVTVHGFLCGCSTLVGNRQVTPEPKSFIGGEWTLFTQQESEIVGARQVRPSPEAAMGQQSEVAFVGPSKIRSDSARGVGWVRETVTRTVVDSSGVTLTETQMSTIRMWRTMSLWELGTDIRLGTNDIRGIIYDEAGIFSVSGSTDKGFVTYTATLQNGYSFTANGSIAEGELSGTYLDSLGKKGVWKATKRTRPVNAYRAGTGFGL